MADEQDEWLDKDAAEKLLRGEPVVPLGDRARDDALRLAEALGAARAVRRTLAGELPGEDAVLTAFRQATRAGGDRLAVRSAGAALPGQPGTLHSVHIGAAPAAPCAARAGAARSASAWPSRSRAARSAGWRSPPVRGCSRAPSAVRAHPRPPPPYPRRPRNPWCPGCPPTTRPPRSCRPRSTTPIRSPRPRAGSPARPRSPRGPGPAPPHPSRTTTARTAGTVRADRVIPAGRGVRRIGRFRRLGRRIRARGRLQGPAGTRRAPRRLRRPRRPGRQLVREVRQGLQGLPRRHPRRAEPAAPDPAGQGRGEPGSLLRPAP